MISERHEEKSSFWLSCDFKVLAGYYEVDISYDHLVAWLGGLSCNAPCGDIRSISFNLISARYPFIYNIQKEKVNYN